MVGTLKEIFVGSLKMKMAKKNTWNLAPPVWINLSLLPRVVAKIFAIKRVLAIFFQKPLCHVVTRALNTKHFRKKSHINGGLGKISSKSTQVHALIINSNGL